MGEGSVKVIWALPVCCLASGPIESSPKKLGLADGDRVSIRLKTCLLSSHMVDS